MDVSRLATAYKFFNSLTTESTGDSLAENQLAMAKMARLMGPVIVSYQFKFYFSFSTAGRIDDGAFSVARNRLPQELTVVLHFNFYAQT